MVSFGHNQGEIAKEFVARTSILDKRFESIGDPSAVLTSSCSCVLLRNCGASSLSAGRDGTETSRAIPLCVLRA